MTWNRGDKILGSILLGMVGFILIQFPINYFTGWFFPYCLTDYSKFIPEIVECVYP